MDEARARRLQPHYVRAFFLAAFKLLGGRIAEREAGRYEIRHVPADVRDRDRQIGIGAPVLRRYERVTFDRELTGPPGRPHAELLAPGHPLLDAVTDLIIERYGSLLKHGTVLVDRHDPGEQPRLLTASHPGDHRRPRPGPYHRQAVRLRRDQPGRCPADRGGTLPRLRPHRRARTPSRRLPAHRGMAGRRGGPARGRLGRRARHARPARQDTGAGLGARGPDPQASPAAAHPGDQLLGRPARRAARSRSRRARS